MLWSNATLEPALRQWMHINPHKFLLCRCHFRSGSTCLYTLRAEIAMSLVFMWPKTFKTQFTFMRKTGDSLKADPARKPLLSRKLKTLPENFPSQKLVQMPSVGKKVDFLLSLAFTIWNWGTHKQHQGECSSSKHGKSFAVGQQAQDTGTALPQAAGWPEDVLVLHQWPVLHPSEMHQHSSRWETLHRGEDDDAFYFFWQKMPWYSRDITSKSLK